MMMRGEIQRRMTSEGMNDTATVEEGVSKAMKENRHRESTATLKTESNVNEHNACSCHNNEGTVKHYKHTSINPYSDVTWIGRSIQ